MRNFTVVFLLLIVASSKLYAETEYSKNILKVCADPYMLPFSNIESEGFENKISELLAEKLEMELDYEFFPQRMGFIRNTLKREKRDGSYPCDLVITVPESFELAATTDPYYTTTYLLAFVKDGKLKGLSSPEDLPGMIKEKNLDIKFGVPDRGPQQVWVFFKELMQYMVTYQGHSGDIKKHPGQLLMEDIAKGKIDATIVWGPTAAYYAKEYADIAEIVLLPMKDNPDNPQERFVYSMSMAVRYGDKEWKQRINNVIKDNIDGIHQILADYGVPLVK